MSKSESIESLREQGYKLKYIPKDNVDPKACTRPWKDQPSDSDIPGGCNYAVIQEDNNNPIERKKDLLEKIKKQIDVETIKKKCEKIFFSLKVTYYLNKNTKIEGQYIKDLDNMTKILSDTLTDYLTKQDKDKNNKTGLGLIRDDKDIHELHLVKKFVDTNSQQGIDITLYKWANKKNLD